MRNPTRSAAVTGRRRLSLGRVGVATVAAADTGAVCCRRLSVVAVTSSARASSAGRGVAVGGEGGEGLEDGPLDFLGNGGPSPPERRDLAGDALGGDGLGIGPGEGRLAGQHLVQHRAQRVDVGAAVEPALAGGLLRAHVRGRADDHAGLGEPLGVARAFQHLADAEVRHQHLAVGGEEHVLRLDVAMDDAVAVGVVQGGRGLARDPERVAHRELLLAGEAGAEGLALDVGHGEPEPAGRVARVEHGEDVRVLEPGREADLAKEALGAESGGELGVEDLEGDGAVVLEVAGEEDGGHATAAELALERVTAAKPCLEVRPQVGHVRFVSGRGWKALL